MNLKFFRAIPPTAKKKLREEALGIPDRSLKADIPVHEDGQWEYGVQEHHALRAGKHYDLRLGDYEADKAYSWAVRHWPEPGEKRLAVRQPDHTIKYMGWEGNIPEGYGAGDVKVFQKGKAEIQKASPNKINFKVKDTQFTLLKTDNDRWLLLNRG